MKKVNSIREFVTKAVLSGGEDCQYVSQKAVILEVVHFDTEFEIRVEDLSKGFDYKKEVVKVFSNRVDANNWLIAYYGDC